MSPLWYECQISLSPSLSRSIATTLYSTLSVTGLEAIQTTNNAYYLDETRKSKEKITFGFMERSTHFVV